jgi:hypothetical protein
MLTHGRLNSGRVLVDNHSTIAAALSGGASAPARRVFVEITLFAPAERALQSVRAAQTSPQGDPVLLAFFDNFCVRLWEGVLL